MQGIERQSLDIFGVLEQSLDIFTNTIFDLVFSGCFFSKEFFNCKTSEIGYGRLTEVTLGRKKVPTFEPWVNKVKMSVNLVKFIFSNYLYHSLKPCQTTDNLTHAIVRTIV